MLVLGDAHAADPANREALLAAYRRADAGRALHVGDLEHYDLPAPTWFVAGNNEDLDVIEAMRAERVIDAGAVADPADAGPERRLADEPVRNAHLLASTAVDLEGLRVAGLSGNFAPTKYEEPRDRLSGDRRRHFTRDDVDRAATLEAVDVFLTHEAPTGLLWYGYDPGCEHVTGLLETLDPELCLVGHHHKHREAEIAGVHTVCLAPVWERYYALDPDELTLEAHEHEGEWTADGSDES